MSTCTLIAANVAGCGVLSQGHQKDIWLINKEDIDVVTEVAGVVTGLTLVLTKKIYSIGGRRKSVDANAEPKTTDMNGATSHTVNFVIFDQTQPGREVMDTLLNGRFVAIVQNADNTYDLYGLNSGLLLGNEGGYNRNNTDTSGGSAQTLATNENESEPKYAQDFTEAGGTAVWIAANVAP